MQSRLLGYQPRPGVAAAVFLALELDAPPNATGGGLQLFRDTGVITTEIRVVSGLMAKSTPLPGTTEEPQTFETIRDLIARPEWNILRPQTRRPQSIIPQNARIIPSLVLDGMGLRIQTARLGHAKQTSAGSISLHHGAWERTR